MQLIGGTTLDKWPAKEKEENAELCVNHVFSCDIAFIEWNDVSDAKMVN